MTDLDIVWISKEEEASTIYRTSHLPIAFSKSKLYYTITRLPFPVQFHFILNSIQCTGLISRVDYTITVESQHLLTRRRPLSKHKTKDSYGASCSKKYVNIPTKPGQNSSTTHQGTNTSPSKVAGKFMFIFHRCDM